MGVELRQLITPEGGFIKELITTMMIPATPETVWQKLTGFNAYPSWNSFITQIDGKAYQGEAIAVTISPPGGKPMTFKAKMIVVEPGKKLAWVGNFIAGWLFRGEHYFDLSTDESGNTLLTHGEKFSGCLVPLLWGQLNTKTRQGFVNMNEDLKKSLIA